MANAKTLPVTVQLNPSAELFAELDRTLSRLANGKRELGRDWLTLAPDHALKDALHISKTHFSIYSGELSVRPFGNIATEEHVQPSEIGFRKHELLLVRKTDSWIAVVIFAKHDQERTKKRKKKRKKKGKKQRPALSFVSGGLPSLGKRR